MFEAERLMEIKSAKNKAIACAGEFVSEFAKKSLTRMSQA